MLMPRYAMPMPLRRADDAICYLRYFDLLRCYAPRLMPLMYIIFSAITPLRCYAMPPLLRFI